MLWKRLRNLSRIAPWCRHAVAHYGCTDDHQGSQANASAERALTTVVWSGVVSVVAFKLVDLTVGQRYLPHILVNLIHPSLFLGWV